MRKKKVPYKVLQITKYNQKPRRVLGWWVFRSSGIPGQDEEALIIRKAKVVDRRNRLIHFYTVDGDVVSVKMFRWSLPDNVPID